MTEKELSENFCRELDAVIAGKLDPSAASDKGAMLAAQKIIAADFSAESALRAQLKARLLPEERRGTSGLAEFLRFMFSNTYLRLAAAAACALIIIAVFPRKPAAPPPVAEIRVAVLPPAPAAVKTPAYRRQTAAAEPAAAHPLFRSIPMNALSDKRTGEFPIHSVKSREIRTGGTERIIWEHESGAFVMERREIKAEDIFERRIL